MFGYHAAKREKKSAKKAQQGVEAQKKAWEEGAPERKKEETERFNTELGERTKRAEETEQTGYEKGQKRGLDVLNMNIPGFEPGQRDIMKYEAQKQIQNAHENANRQLLGEQSRRGIIGKGGVGYAQQRDLQKLRNEAEGQAWRDLEKLNADLAIKKKAALFAAGQGGAANASLNERIARDELNLQKERDRMRILEDELHEYFTKVG